MASKSKDVRTEQRRILEKKLELRLAKLAAQGLTGEKVNRDAQVKSLKSKIRETKARIAAFDKNVEKVEAMKQAKEQKLAEKAAPKAAPAAPEKDAKSKKKAAAGEKEPKKKAEAGEKSKKKKEGA